MTNLSSLSTFILFSFLTLVSTIPIKASWFSEIHFLISPCFNGSLRPLIFQHPKYIIQKASRAYHSSPLPSSGRGSLLILALPSSLVRVALAPIRRGKRLLRK
jgi:hypothetical protein